MKFTPYLAHIAADGRVQTALSHLTGTATLATEFAHPFGGEEQAELASLAHDIGKYSRAFQKRLRGASLQVNHSAAGAYECWRLGQPFAAFAVDGHHGGLHDGGSRTDTPDDATLLGHIRRRSREKPEPYDYWKEEISLPRAGIPDFVRRGPLEGMFFTRMLYSCLVDADYLDTEAFMTGLRREPANGASMEELWDKLQSYISSWFPPVGELNRQRCAILERCIQEGQQRKPGLFSLTAPTGGGKTISSLAFALAHAKAQGLRRVIYVIPYTSIIEQTAQVFRSVLGDENVLEHHSNVLYDPKGATDIQSSAMAGATENWNMPVIVTTAVQFFESLYACRPSQCRKLHNIASSVVIFDEAQMMPIPYLRPCVHAISQLVAHYQVSAVLCTATQPALEPLFRQFLPDFPITELSPPELQWGSFRRVSFQQEGHLSWDELARRLNQKAQVLCIVNTRKSAQELFGRLERTGRFHLSTLMCPAHRRSQLQEIRRRLSAGLPCRVVSTSLIEAGTDVDFPSVYREMAGLDSILQAAGRCNREGKRPVEESTVAVFQGERSAPPLFATAIGAGKAVIMQHRDITTREAVRDYFHQLLDLKGPEAQDIQGILPTIQTEFFPFRTVAERFHLIDSPTRTVYLPLRDGKALIERLRSGHRDRNLFRRLGHYSVSIYEHHFAALAEAGDLELLEGGIAILRNTSLYSEEWGLSLAKDNGKKLFI